MQGIDRGKIQPAYHACELLTNLCSDKGNDLEYRSSIFVAIGVTLVPLPCTFDNISKI